MSGQWVVLLRLQDKKARRNGDPSAASPERLHAIHRRGTNACRRIPDRRHPEAARSAARDHAAGKQDLLPAAASRAAPAVLVLALCPVSDGARSRGRLAVHQGAAAIRRASRGLREPGAVPGQAGASTRSVRCARCGHGGRWCRRMHADAAADTLAHVVASAAVSRPRGSRRQVSSPRNLSGRIPRQGRCRSGLLPVPLPLRSVRHI